MGTPSDSMRELERDRVLLERSSTAERVAEILRERIIEGLFTPGQKLSEKAIGDALNVSRNTLREAFRLLSHERLLVHELNRGVFVRSLTADDVKDIYQVRRVIEGSAVRQARAIPQEVLDELRRALREGEESATREDWRAVGTANMRFHRALVALSGSRRLDDIMRQVFAELRLVFQIAEDPKALHYPFVSRNADLLALLEEGDTAAAERMLADYLDDAERLLVEAARTATAAS